MGMSLLHVAHGDETAARRAERSVWEDAREWLGTSEGERARALASVVRFADEMVDQSPYRMRIRSRRDPRSREAERMWIDLVRRYRGQ